MTSEHGGEAPCAASLFALEGLDDAVLATLVRDLADAVVISDADGTIVFWNEAATALFGWPAGEAIGQTLDLIVPEKHRARHWAGYRQVMATGETDYAGRLLEVPALHRDGTRRSIAFTVTVLRPAGMTIPCGIAAVIRDDTERRAELRRLAEPRPSTDPGST